MKISLIFVIIACSCIVAFGQIPDTVWLEDWESGWGDWYASGGVWEIGVPGPLGPDSVCSGYYCAKLDPYPENTSTKLISPLIELPSSAENLRLGFWHWFDTYHLDQGQIEIKIDHPDSDWVAISEPFHLSGGQWTPYLISLEVYMGETVRLAFHINSGGHGGGVWYTDDLCVISGEYVPDLALEPENFENGWNDWYASGGVWDIGPPDSPGPEEAFSGVRCAGTVLAGGYPRLINSRLVSPPFYVPNDEPLLKFWHWFHNRYDDYGVVEIKIEHPDSDWVEISDHFNPSSQVWTRYQIELDSFAGEFVRIAFRFDVGSPGNFPGWYVDSVTIHPTDDISDNAESIPLAFKLFDNYPNPFNSQTIIQYNLAEPSRVKIEVYDLMGRSVTSILDKYQSVGHKQAIWDAGDLPSGLYLYRIQAGDFRQAGKMLLLR
ncbi:MAG: T9SS type A sorting domain-containing protein [candidate division Zixibacteria bacterium]|nr:T9SS type A sorting domain-containing protein [candidate division Zixibacteria bacterium]